MSRKPAAITRRPSPSNRSTWACASALRPSSHGTLFPPDRAVAARSITAGAAPFTKQRTTAVPDASTLLVKTAISLYVESNGRVATREYCSRVPSTLSPAFAPSTSRAPSVGSPTTLPSSSLASLATMNGIVDGGGRADGVLHGALEAASHAGDGVAVDRVEH